MLTETKDIESTLQVVYQQLNELLRYLLSQTVAYQAENLLNQETPLEVLLTRLEDAKKQNQNTQILEKQINERMEELSSRYLLIRNISQIDSSLNNHANTHE